MNQYQITGLVILIGLIITAGLTFWPVNTIPIIEVSLPAATVDVAEVPAVVAPKAAAPKAPTAPTTPTSPGAGVRTFENGFYVTTVHYTAQGFVPAKIEVNNGEEIRFVNKTSSAMHIQAESNSSSQYYRAINQPNTVFKNGNYQLQVPEMGVFNYYNINTNPKVSGQIIVK